MDYNYEYVNNYVEKYVRKDWDPFLNFIKCLEDKRALRPNVKSYPFVAYLDPTSYCNLQCPFCVTGQRINARSPLDMSFIRFKKIIEEFRDNLFHIFFYNWGEPLLNKELIRMIRFIQTFNISSEISTNLSIPLDKEKAKEFVSSGLDKMVLSVDGGTQETYQKYRVGGNLKLVLKNMRLLADAKSLTDSNIDLVWRFFVFKHNQHEINEAKSMAHEIGIRIEFLPGFVDPEKRDEWAASGEFKDEFWPYEKKGVTFSQEEQIEFAKKHSGYLMRKLTRPSGCDWLWFATCINPNGTISPCCVTTLQIQDFASIDEKKFMDIWNNDKFMTARRYTSGVHVKDPMNTICQRCPALEIWHTIDYNLIPIFLAINKKLSESDLDLKYLKPDEIKGVGNYSSHLELNTIGWDDVNKMKNAILIENQ